MLASSSWCYADICPKCHVLLRRGVPFARAVIAALPVSTRRDLSALIISDCCQTGDMARSPSQSVSCIRPSAGPKLPNTGHALPVPSHTSVQGREHNSSSPGVKLGLATSPPSANNGYSHLLLWGVSGRTYCQILAHFNYCTCCTLQIILGWTCLLSADFISVFSPQPAGCMGCLQIPQSLQCSSRLCPALDFIYFYFAMMELVCISVVFNFLAFCLADKWYKTGNILIMVA